MFIELWRCMTNRPLFCFLHCHFWFVLLGLDVTYISPFIDGIRGTLSVSNYKLLFTSSQVGVATSYMCLFDKIHAITVGITFYCTASVTQYAHCSQWRCQPWNCCQPYDFVQKFQCWVSINVISGCLNCVILFHRILKLLNWRISL
jgi:hypothetical protein